MSRKKPEDDGIGPAPSQRNCWSKRLTRFAEHLRSVGPGSELHQYNLNWDWHLATDPENPGQCVISPIGELVYAYPHEWMWYEDKKTRFQVPVLKQGSTGSPWCDLRLFFRIAHLSAQLLFRPVSDKPEFHSYNKTMKLPPLSHASRPSRESMAERIDVWVHEWDDYLGDHAIADLLR